MKVAISSSGKDLNSPVDPRFGCANYLIIAETDTEQISDVIDNITAKSASQGAGINATSRIAEAGAKAILTGQVGPKAAAVCDKANVVIINNVTGTVQEAINNYNGTTNTAQFKINEKSTSMTSEQCRGAGRGMGGGGRGRGGGCGRQR